MSAEILLTHPPAPCADPSIADYDSHDYDYRSFWATRGYEQWAENRALGAVADRMRPDARTGWIADLGGGFGRNVPHARRFGERVVLVDYSTNNLRTAAHLHAEAVASGRLLLVRADVTQLPFRDGVFDAALAVRVLHHLVDLDTALPEMLRTVNRSALFDVPIKHHLLARMRAVRAGRTEDLRSREPLVVGTSEHPFRQYHLPTVHDAITGAGFACETVASVNNLRRWDQKLPSAAVRMLTLPARVVEGALQPAGIGWWGPNQFVLATRREQQAAPAVAKRADLFACPYCRSDLEWSDEAARCASCYASYARRGPFWDFTG